MAAKNKPGLAKNFRPHVTLKKDSICSLKRHYRGALREFVGYCDLLASQDSERFVWASFSDIAKHCTNYSNKKLYSLRIVKYCKNTLRDQNIISGQIERIRDGVRRQGFIMVAHDSVARSSGKQCVFREQIAPMVAPLVAPTIALAVAPVVAPQNEKSCTDDCTDGCTSEAPQEVKKSDDCGQPEKVLPEFGGSLAGSILVNLSSSEPGKPWEPQKNSKSGEPNSFLPDSSDLTVTTIGSQINTGADLDELISQMSDGELDTAKLEEYEHSEELQAACLKAIVLKSAKTFNRKNLGDLMGKAMEILRKQYSVDAPKPWVPVIKVLRQGGRCITPVRQKGEPITTPRDLWNDSQSSLKCYATELQSVKTLIETAGKDLPVPSSWTEAVTFLDAVIQATPDVPEVLLTVRNTIQERVPVCVAN